MQGIGKLFQVVHGAELGLHFAITRNRIATVVRTGARFKERHQVEIGNPEVFQVIDVFADAPKIPGETICIRRIPDHVRLLIPIRLVTSLKVAMAERRLAVVVRFYDEVHDARQ